MKKSVICLMIIIAFASCQKEECDNNSPFIGAWRIERIDSVTVYTYPTTVEFRVEKELKNSGKFVFNSNTTGTVNCDLLGLTNHHKDFVWDYDSINQMIDFSFKNGTTVGLITELSDSIMTMYFRYYIGFPDWSARLYYKLTLKK